MYSFIFTKIWEKEFLKLDTLSQNRVIKKLQLLKESDDINHYLKTLVNFTPATHRLRIWSIRVILQKTDETTFYILDIGYRWNIYK